MKTLKAKEGMWLTQAADVSDCERFYAAVIYAPDNVWDDEYRDATDLEKQDWESRVVELEKGYGDGEVEDA